jgi:hypothetical protein
MARTESVEGSGQGLGVERLHGVHLDGDPLGLCQSRARPDRLLEVAHELVAPPGNEEGDMEIAGAGEERGGDVAAEIKCADSLLDLFGGPRPHAGTAIEYAIHRRERHARRPRNIMHRRPPQHRLILQPNPRSVCAPETWRVAWAASTFSRSFLSEEFAVAVNTAIT